MTSERQMDTQTVFAAAVWSVAATIGAITNEIERLTLAGEFDEDDYPGRELVAMLEVLNHALTGLQVP